MSISNSPVYMVSKPHSHNIKLNTFKMIVAIKFTVTLQNSITGNHRKRGKSKYDRELYSRN